MGKRNRDNQVTAAEEVIPPVPDKPQQCHYFVKRKKRYCHLPARKTNKYCGEHLQHEDNADLKDGVQDPKRIRIPCPYDSNHTVYQHELENHLKTRCNSRPPEIMPDYHSLNANVNIDQNLENDKKLNELEKGKISKLLNNLSSGYDKLVPNIDELISDHISMDTQREKKKVYKHVDQQASLIGHMKRLGLFRKDACYIEFGAGKGELSLHLLNALAHDTKELEEPSDPTKTCQFVLVDRRNFRQKFDRHLRDEINRPQWIQDTEFHRINIDIKDLDLTKLKIATNRPVIAFSKHLCGSATDLTLSALSKLQKEHNNVVGIVIALCCHQVCKPSMYPNLKFFLNNEIIDQSKDLSYLSTISSWAICGHRDNKQADDEIDDDKSEQDSDNQKDRENNDKTAADVDKELNKEETQSQDKIEHYSGLSHADREILGYKTKRLIDTGRLNYLQEELDFNVELVKYVDKSVSLENVALIATPKPKD